MSLWRKNGGPIAALPERDQAPDGSWWTDLANNPAGRSACGWADAGVPETVTMAQARVALLNAGKLAEVDAWVADQDKETQIFWASSAVLRRNSSRLLAAAAAKGWDEAYLDTLFVAAAAVD